MTAPWGIADPQRFDVYGRAGTGRAGREKAAPVDWCRRPLTVTRAGLSDSRFADAQMDKESAGPDN